MSTQYEDTSVDGFTPNVGPTVHDDIVERSRVRWGFNPAARIAVRDRVVGNEFNDKGVPVARSFIKAGTLTPYRNVTYNTPRPKDQPPAPGSTPQQQRLVANTKYAADIAEELAFAYADTGYITVDALTGIEDEALVRSIFRLCMGTQIKVATDPALPGEKIPVIPAMIEHLSTKAPAVIEDAFKDKKDPELKATVEETRRQLLASCTFASTQWARANIVESKQSIADRAGGHPGKAQFDLRDRRVFAALGEAIPTEIQATNPTVEKALEYLMQEKVREAQKPVEDPRIAQLEAAIQKQQAQIEQLTKKGKAA